MSEWNFEVRGEFYMENRRWFFASKLRSDGHLVRLGLSKKWVDTIKSIIKTITKPHYFVNSFLIRELNQVTWEVNKINSNQSIYGLVSVLPNQLALLVNTWSHRFLINGLSYITVTCGTICGSAHEKINLDHRYIGV